MCRENWMPEYIEKLEDENISFFDVVQFIKQHMPRKLYSYRRINDYWRENIFKGCVHLTSASEFNDPFDCFPTIDFIKDTGTISKAYREYSKSTKPEYREAKKEIDKVVRELLGKNQRDTLVSCFTEKKDSILMWSYYTENHKGFCIEYDTAKAEIFHQQVLPVIYDDNRYNAIRLLETKNNNIILNPYVYKAKCWKHEKEWRILSTHCEEIHPNDNVYLKEAITGVYLGAKIDKDIEEEIKNWGKTEKIPIYKMELDNQKYILNSKCL